MFIYGMSYILNFRQTKFTFLWVMSNAMRSTAFEEESQSRDIFFYVSAVDNTVVKV